MAQAVVDRIPRLLPCLRASVVLYHPETRELSLLAAYSREGASDLGQAWRRPAGPPGDPVLETLMRGERYAVEDLQALNPYSPLIAQLQAEGVRAHLYEPIRIQDQFAGMLSLGMAAPGPLSSEQIQVLHELSMQLAIGLEQAHLQDEVQRYARELERLVRQRTAELEASEARFRTIFEEAAIGIALADTQGRLVAANPALQRMLGYGETELIGMRFADLIADATSDEEAQLSDLLSRRRDEVRLELIYRRQDGEKGQANVTASLLRLETAPSPLVLALVEDVTEQKRAQEALIQAERLAIMGRMAATLAHEVNNPIQAVVGCLDLAVERIQDGQDATAFLDAAIEESIRAAQIVHRMHDLGRREKGEKKPVVLGELVDRIILLTQKHAQNHQVELTWEPGQGLPAVPVVRDRIQQVFLNLVLNAIDAMPGGGELRIRAVATHEPPGAQISFADTGVGIALQEAEHLFEAFHSTKETGLGLGLYVTRNILLEHGGSIDVESDPGHGATFTVWLPAA
jgi:PAS domain S-box-containing protein